VLNVIVSIWVLAVYLYGERIEQVRVRSIRNDTRCSLSRTLLSLVYARGKKEIRLTTDTDSAIIPQVLLGILDYTCIFVVDDGMEANSYGIGVKVVRFELQKLK